VQSVINEKALREGYFLRMRDALFFSHLLGDSLEEGVRGIELLEQAGASILDFTNSGPVAGPDVVRAVKIPVIGGLGGGPWLDGRVRALVAAIGYLASAVDDTKDRYANVAEIALTAIKTFSDDVRAARQIKK